MGIFDQRYIDQDYEGVIIKIPTYILDLNPELNTELLKFKEKMAEGKFGTQHPDFQKSIFEIENVAKKKDFAKEQRESLNAQRERSKKEEERKLNHIEIPIVIKKYTSNSGNYHKLWFNEGDVMEDQLISFETAKLAKEKGFDLNTYSNCWVKTLDGDVIHNSERRNISEHDRCTQHLMQPTQSLLQKWLLEKHNLFVSVELAYSSWGSFAAKVEKKGIPIRIVKI